MENGIIGSPESRLLLLVDDMWSVSWLSSRSDGRVWGDALGTPVACDREVHVAADLGRVRLLISAQTRTAQRAFDDVLRPIFKSRVH